MLYASAGDGPQQHNTCLAPTTFSGFRVGADFGKEGRQLLNGINSNFATQDTSVGCPHNSVNTLSTELYALKMVG